MHKIINCIVALVLSGCASTGGAPAPRTASGHPEITVKNSNTAEIKTKLANVFINDGFSIISSNDLGAEFDQKSSNIALDVLASCRYCASPRARINLSILQVGKDVRVVASPYWLVNPGSASEHRIQIEEGDAANYVRKKINALAD